MRAAPHGMQSSQNQSALAQLPHEIGRRSVPNAVGINPLVVRFADRVADAGMTVYLPSLFGQPGRPASGAVTSMGGDTGSLSSKLLPIGQSKGKRRLISW